MIVESGLILLKAALPIATKKIATTVQTKLHPSELERAIATALEESEALKTQQKAWNPVFSQCEPNKIDEFLTEWLKHSAVQGELQKPLQEEGLPDVTVLVKAAEQVGNDREIPIALAHLEPWLTRFAQAYFDRTSECLRFRVAQENYLSQVANWFDDVKFAGVDVPGYDVEKAEKLAQIFVMPEVREERSRRGFDSALKLSDGEIVIDEVQAVMRHLLPEQRDRSLGARSGRKFVAQQLLTQNVGRAVILGEPGSGKSTLVNYFAVMLAQGEGEKELGLAGEWLPIVIRMRDWVLHPGLGVCEYVRQFAETTLSVKALPAGLFEYWLGRGRALILLDGLDEVPEAGRRHEFVLRIENFLGQHSQNRAIVTSRPAGYRRDFFRTEEFPHYELLPFDDDRIRQFIDHWYDSRVDDPAEAKRRKESLGRAIDQQDRIKLLARNPLLLTIIALIHRYQARLPKERHKLYDRAVETLLTSWDSNKELSDRTVLKFLALDDLRRLMEGLAYWIHTQGSTGDSEGGTLIDREELIEQLGKEIQALKGVKRYEAREEAKRFVGLIRDRTGLLNEQGQDCYAFVHKTFQEYLAAQEIRYRADDEDEFEIVLRHIDEHLHDPHWREVLLLLVAEQPKKKAARAIRRVLERGSEYERWLHRDLLFAGRCLAEDPKDLNGGDSALAGEILDGLIELEVSDSEQVGEKIREEVFQIFCNLNESAFEAETLQRLKSQSRLITKYRLHLYQSLMKEIEVDTVSLLARLTDEDGYICFKAGEVLRQLGNSSESEAVVQALLKQLTDEDPRVRLKAASALGNLDNPSDVVVQALLEQLTDEDSEVRSTAASALGKLVKDSEVVVQALLKRLIDRDSRVRFGTASALGNLENASDVVVQALLERLTDKDSEVRSGATWALSRLSNPTEVVVQALLAKLTDEDSEVRSTAALALSRLSNPTEVVVQALLAKLTDEEWSVRNDVRNALSNLENASEAVVQALLIQLTDEDSRVRLRATSALCDLDSTPASMVQALLERLTDTDEDSQVRSCAAGALSKLSNPTEVVMQALLEQLTDEDSEVRSGATWALGELVKDSELVVQALLARLTDEDSGVRSRAAGALSRLSNPTEVVVQALLARLTDEDSGVRSRAAGALGELGNASESVVQALLAQLTDKESGFYAVLSLGELGNASESVVQALLAQLTDEELGMHAALALGELGKTTDLVKPVVVQWIEQHQGSPTVGHGIDALWQIVSE